MHHKKHHPIIVGIIFLILLISNTIVYAQTIRVAILDNPNMPAELKMWRQYEKSYLRGINTAKYVSKKKNVNIIYKTFFYGTDALDVLKEIPKVKAWHPDIILGPHYSNQFLLLKNYFKHTLVLSSYASDAAIDHLPDNFYSVFPPDKVTIKAMLDFIHHNFPKKNILLINRVDCKDCNDMSALIHKMYKNFNVNVKIKQNNFIGNSDNLEDTKNLLKGYKKGDVIIILATNLYNYADLIAKITTTLHNRNPIFISIEDNWGNWNNGLPISKNTNLKFTAYLVNPLFFNHRSLNFRIFYVNYFDLYANYPKDVVSYVTFMTLMSAIDASNQYPVTLKSHLSMKQKILKSYLAALKHNQNWYRPTVYGVFQLNADGSKLIMKKNMSTELASMQQ